MKQPSRTTCFPRFAEDEHSDCHTGTVVLSAPTPHPRIKRPTTNWATLKLVHCKISPMRVRRAAKKIVFLRPRTSPIHEQAREPKRAPIVKVATTAPCTVDLWLFSAPLASMVLISGKWSFQSRSDRSPEIRQTSNYKAIFPTRTHLQHQTGCNQTTQKLAGQPA